MFKVRTTLKVDGMTCEHCAETVTKALQELDGIHKTEVDLKKGLARLPLFEFLGLQEPKYTTFIIRTSINDYLKSERMEDCQKRLSSLVKADLLYIDQFGYLPHNQETGPFFYQAISNRYQKKRTIVECR